MSINSTCLQKKGSRAGLARFVLACALLFRCAVPASADEFTTNDEQQSNSSQNQKLLEIRIFQNQQASTKHKEMAALDKRDDQSINDYGYIGNIDSLKFHHAECEYAHLMAKCRRIKFKDKEDAIEAGLKACNWCMPKWWTSVKGEILRTAPAAQHYEQCHHL